MLIKASRSSRARGFGGEALYEVRNAAAPSGVGVAYGVLDDHGAILSDRASRSPAWGLYAKVKECHGSLESIR
jgi:hypothetical protein